MLWGGGQGIPVRCFIRFALPCPAASCVGKPMVVVAVQGPPLDYLFTPLYPGQIEANKSRGGLVCFLMWRVNGAFLVNALVLAFQARCHSSLYNVGDS